MIKKKFVDLNFKIITQFKNKTFYVTKKIRIKNIFSINTFSYGENNIPKIIKIIKDENNKNKIIYKNFDENEIEKKEFKAELNEKELSKKNDINSPKLKIFGHSQNGKNDNLDSNSYTSKKNDDNFNIFNEPEKHSNQENENNLSSEEIKENLLNYNSFFSDYCRIYVKAGDGGNGSISVLKGPMFDQGI
jgi:hypothetical protein